MCRDMQHLKTCCTFPKRYFGAGAKNLQRVREFGRFLYQVGGGAGVGGAGSEAEDIVVTRDGRGAIAEGVVHFSGFERSVRDHRVIGMRKLSGFVKSLGGFFEITSLPK